MKTTKTVTINETREVPDKTFCDLCKKVITDDYPEVRDVAIECRNGYMYPEGGSVEVTEYDICVGCFLSKVSPWLRSQGAEPRQRETG